MEDYRAILYKRASTNLPDWTKGPNDFYVAILPYMCHVRSCTWKDFHWLKVNGKNTISQVKKFYKKNFYSTILLKDGTNTPSDGVEIRSLDHFMSDLVVFWTVLDYARPVLQHVSGGRHNVPTAFQEPALKRKISGSESNFGSDLNPNSLIKRARVTYPELGTAALNQELIAVQDQYPTSSFKVHESFGARSVQCSHCSDFSLPAPMSSKRELIRQNMQQHLNTSAHRARALTRFVAPEKYSSAPSHYQSASTSNWLSVERKGRLLGTLWQAHPLSDLDIAPLNNWPHLKCNTCNAHILQLKDSPEMTAHAIHYARQHLVDGRCAIIRNPPKLVSAVQPMPAVKEYRPDGHVRRQLLNKLGEIYPESKLHIRGPAMYPGLRCIPCDKEIIKLSDSPYLTELAIGMMRNHLESECINTLKFQDGKPFSDHIKPHLMKIIQELYPLAKIDIEYLSWRLPFSLLLKCKSCNISLDEMTKRTYTTSLSMHSIKVHITSGKCSYTRNLSRLKSPTEEQHSFSEKSLKPGLNPDISASQQEYKAKKLEAKMQRAESILAKLVLTCNSSTLYVRATGTTPDICCQLCPKFARRTSSTVKTVLHCEMLALHLNSTEHRMAIERAPPDSPFRSLAPVSTKKEGSIPASQNHWQKIWKEAEMQDVPKKESVSINENQKDDSMKGVDKIPTVSTPPSRTKQSPKALLRNSRLQSQQTRLTTLKILGDLRATHPSHTLHRDYTSSTPLIACSLCGPLNTANRELLVLHLSSAQHSLAERTTREAAQVANPEAKSTLRPASHSNPDPSSPSTGLGGITKETNKRVPSSDTTSASAIQTPPEPARSPKQRLQHNRDRAASSLDALRATQPDHRFYIAGVRTTAIRCSRCRSFELSYDTNAEDEKAISDAVQQERLQAHLASAEHVASFPRRVTRARRLLASSPTTHT